MSASTSKCKFRDVDDGESDRKILMAVDFGTTFSGLAWSQTRKASTDWIVETTKLTICIARYSDAYYTLA